MGNRRDMAKVHARRVHTCPLCGKDVKGNGGRASHRRKHVREAGLDQRDYRDLGHAFQAARSVLRDRGDY